MIKINRMISKKKRYQRPQLKNLGSVKALTLKLGSDTDMMGGHV